MKCFLENTIEKKAISVFSNVVLNFSENCWDLSLIHKKFPGDSEILPHWHWPYEETYYIPNNEKWDHKKMQSQQHEQ